MLKRIAIYTTIAMLALVGAATFIYANLEKYVPPRLIPPASHWVDENKPLREQTARVELGGRVFNIPQMYVESKMPLNGTLKDSVLLEVIWPEMKSIYELNSRQEYEQIWKKERRLGWIHAETASLKPTLDSMIENNNATHAKTELVGNQDGLEMHRWYHAKENQFILSDEVYLQLRDGHVISYIQCDVFSRGMYPRCNHRFVENGILYDFSYTKASFFSEWREQERRVSDFFSSFELGNNK